VSWPLAAFLLVAAVLAVGWLLYERARPSARMVAVVATLSALAALGRDAFVAVPDVKPITAITLVTGYGLGPLPGFTVGALGMLASNVLLGQGPYTPWQMAGWGLVGLIGAALGSISGRSLGRFGLACACMCSAAVAKEVMNLYTWTVGASHTPAAFLAVAGTALPFDVTDAVASLLFGLAFGPELARLLARVRLRLNVSWEAADGPPADARPQERRGYRPLSGPTALAQIRAVGVALLGSARPAAAANLGPEISFLAGSQNGDGGFGAARGQASSELYTAWAAMGLAAAYRNPLTVRRNGHTPLDALRAQASTLSGPGDAERTILAAHVCGASAYSFAGRNLVAEVMAARGRDHSFAHQVNLTAFAIFALRAVGHSPGFRPIRDAAGWIERQQNSDGGFGFGSRGSSSDVDDTGAAVQALVDGGARNRRVLGAAYGYLLRSQNLDGGFPQRYGGESNAQSTAFAVQGFIAVGRNPATVRRRGSRSAKAYLESLVTSSGSVRYSRTNAQTPVWVTAQALIALAGWTFPV
jgi:energy-coupling factor transport system substrate-specific component